MRLPDRRVLRWDPYLEPNKDDVEFRLTYAGPLLSHRDDKRLPERSLHVHKIRKEFHEQLKILWNDYPTLRQVAGTEIEDNFPVLTTDQELPSMKEVFVHDGFNWLPIVTEKNGLICKLDILMLRPGIPGEVLHDIDNRLKTLFDALRKAKGPSELGLGTVSGQIIPAQDENPFYVLLEDDKLITHISVTSDSLLQPVPDTPPDTAVRLVISVTVRPYRVHLANLGYT
jgi:hypothetical protein